MADDVAALLARIHALAVKARDMARSIALTAGLLDEARFNAAIERSKRWQAIADELEPTNG